MLQRDATAIDKPWSGSRFGLAVILVFGLHLVLLFYLSKPGSPEPAPRHPGSSFRLDAASFRDSAEVHPTLFRDPSLFNLPYVRGFSAGVWDTRIPIERPNAIWSEAPIWLTQSPNQAEQDVKDYLDDLEETRVNVRLPSPHTADFELSPSPLRHRSWLRIEGALAHRTLRQAPEPPLIESAVPLPPTIVEIAVDELGRPVVRRVLHASGSPKADQEAMRLISELWFAPHQSTQLDWGWATFEWQITFPVIPAN